MMTDKLAAVVVGAIMDTFPDMSEYDVALIGAAVTERLESPEGIAALAGDRSYAKEGASE